VKTSLQGRNLIIRAEGFRGDAYLCSAGVPTIGFGSIRYQDRDKVCLGDTISRDDAEKLLTYYISTQIDPMVPRLITRPLTQPQYDAFASFLYNFGYEKTRGYNLTKVIADGPEDNTLEALRAWEAKIIHWWPVYRMAGGKPLLGLYRRRVAELLTFLHLPPDVAWTLPHMGVNLDELVANMRAGKPLVSEPKLAPPVPPPAPPFAPPLPPSSGGAPPISAPVPPIAPPAPPAPEPIPALEVPPAHTEEISMSAPEAKPALKSKTIWGVLVLVMAPFVGQIGEALQVAGATAPSTGEAIADITSTAMTFVGAILAVIGRMAAAQPLR
jgi:lysozyme